MPSPPPGRSPSEAAGAAEPRRRGGRWLSSGTPGEAREMEFLEVVGRRRSIRWFAPRQPVPAQAVQRILETARMTGSPGNTQPWRAVVVVADDLEPTVREALLEANNHQRRSGSGAGVDLLVRRPRRHDPAGVPRARARAAPRRVDPGLLRLDRGGGAGGRSRRRVRAAERGLPALDATIHGLPPEVERRPRRPGDERRMRRGGPRGGQRGPGHLPAHRRRSRIARSR